MYGLNDNDMLVEKNKGTHQNWKNKDVISDHVLAWAKRMEAQIA